MTPYNVKIIGAGSIGNHLSNACRSLGWKVDLCDVDGAALERTRTQIYPGRYGAWDDGIQLHLMDDAPTGGYDLICIGTPPDSHTELANQALREQPRAVLVEKPLCRPDLSGADTLRRDAADAGIPIFVGYDHAVGRAAEEVRSIVSRIGKVETIDVEFREHWKGIFAAHPWLSGPRDSYLGFWRRGGGASGEHSHATHLWQCFAHAVGAGRVVEVNATMNYIDDGDLEYDSLYCVTLRTESGLIGRVVQDVFTWPARKWGRIQGDQGAVEWVGGHRAGADAVILHMPDTDARASEFEKTRPDDFIKELRHIADMVENGGDSPLSLERGLETMAVLRAAHASADARRPMRIDYGDGYAAVAFDAA